MIRLRVAATLALALAFVVAWFAPLLRAGMLPIFGLDEISILTGLQSLWATDIPLALVVSFLAIFAPVLKLLGAGLVQAGLLSRKVLPALHFLGRLAMADVFLMALYIVLAKGAGWATVEAAWGLYLFTFCVLGSLVLGRRI